MGKISLEMQADINPISLRKHYGDEIGNEVWFLTRIIKKDDVAIKTLLKTLDMLQDERKLALIHTIWQQYYRNIADKLINNN